MTPRWRLSILATLILYAASAAADPPPALVRIVVLDVSSSMEGERIEFARGDILAQARLLPPSPQMPFVVVPFNHQPVNVQTFTDMPALEKYLKDIKANGSTSIASGLARGRAEFQPYRDTAQVALLFYSDGEDDDLDGIRKEEEELDRLFADRSKRGLQQTAVFCKRWGGANGELVARLKKGGNVQVIDAGEFRLVSVALVPTARVTGVAWAKDAPGFLDVTLVATVSVKGKADQKILPAVRWTCRTPGARGDTAVDVKSDESQPKRLALRLPVAPEVTAAGRTQINFALATSTQAQSTGSVIFPLLSLNRLTVPLELPRLQIANTLAVTLQCQPGTWADPVKLRPAYPITLVVSVTSSSSQPWTSPVTFTLTPLASCRITAGADTFTMSGPGSRTLTLTVEGDALANLTKLCPIGFRVVAKSPPTYLTFDPPEALAIREMPPPPAMQTTVAARVVSVGPARWTDLRHSYARFEAGIEFTVHGPIAPHTDLSVQCPSTVRDITFTPAKISTGTQKVRCTIEARLPRAPGKESLSFRIVPPRCQGAVQIVPPAPLSLTAFGPAPLQLVLSQGTSSSRMLEATILDSGTTAAARVVPTVIGLAGDQAAQGLKARIKVLPPLELTTADTIPVLASTDLSFHVGQPVAVNFFQDTVIQSEIWVTPVPETPAVLGTKYPMTSRMEAPFKRLLLYLVLSIAAVLMVFLFARLYRRFTEVA